MTLIEVVGMQKVREITAAGLREVQKGKIEVQHGIARAGNTVEGYCFMAHASS